MVRLIFGEESYLANDAWVKAKKQYKKPEVFYEFNSETIAACCQKSLFHFGSVRGVFVRLDLLEPNDLLEQYLKDPSVDCDLYVYADKVNKNLNVYKAFGENVQEFKRVDAATLQTYILHYINKRNAKITKDAYALFIERIGYLGEQTETTLWDIFQTLNQLVLLNGGQITAEIVEQEVRNQYADIYSLSKLYMTGQFEKLLEAVDTLSEEKGFSSIRTLSLLLRNWRCAYQKKVLGWQVWNVYVKADMTGKDLMREMKIIADGIRNIKTGLYTEQNGLKMVVLQMIGGMSYAESSERKQKSKIEKESKNQIKIFSGYVSGKGA